MQGYTFDLKLYATVTVPAQNEQEARQMLAEAFADADTNFGAWPSGDPILGRCGGLMEKPLLMEAPELKWHLFANYGYEDQQDLSSWEDFHDAREEYRKLTEDPPRGARIIELAQFAWDGEYMPEERHEV